jgi:hypothetical protein
VREVSICVGFHITLKMPGKTRCVLLHYYSSKHCACPVNKFISALRVVKLIFNNKQQTVALVRERTTPIKRPPPASEVSAKFCG